MMNSFSNQIGWAIGILLFQVSAVAAGYAACTPTPINAIYADYSGLSLSLPDTNGTAIASINLATLSPTPVPFTITNISPANSWLTITPASGSLQAGSIWTLTVHVNGFALTSGGPWSGSFEIQQSNGLALPVSIKVALGSGINPYVVLTASQSCVSLSTDGPTQQNMFFTASDLTGSVQMTATSQGSVNWLGVEFVSTPEIYVVLTPAALQLPAGTYYGSVNILPEKGTELSIPVTYTVSSPFAVTPSTLTVETQGTVQQNVAISGPPNNPFTPSVQTADRRDWLSVSQQGSLTLPTNLTVTVNAAGLSNGTYTGEVDLNFSYSTTKIPVTLTVAPSGEISVSSASGASSLTFAAAAYGAISAAQQLQIVRASGSPSFVFSYSTSTPWLRVNHQQTGKGFTPLSISVTVDPSTLAAGSYQGGITFTPDGGHSVVIPVTLTVSSGSLSTAPASLAFSYTVGGDVPRAQTVQIFGNGSALAFTASAQSQGGWLVVSPTSGTTVASATTAMTVSVTNLASLAANQMYTGTVNLSGAGTAAITVVLTVVSPPPAILKMTNAASYADGSIAAGEIITIFGTGMGPSTPAAVSSDSITSGRLPTTLAGVQVMIGGYAAPLLYVSASQISAIVPYEIAAPVFVHNPNISVAYLTQSSIPVQETQAAIAPGIFTANSSGNGPGAILNSDASSNSPANPAARGDVVVLYLTGEGQTAPSGVSGGITPLTPPYLQPLLLPSVTISGENATVLFAAEAPGLVSGVMQVNVQVPADIAPGNSSVIVSLGGVTSQVDSPGHGSVTVAVK
jgi:uncharacterized protein (TIGR03437 family)